uniref:Putative chaperone n=1 Tax=viral metagenome TaxID=1070528 RepID=A0A6M3LNK0_9ZZZZ
MNISEALGIIKPKIADRESLREAYRAACKIYHPDINPNGLEMMKLVNAAYDLLKGRFGEWKVKDTPDGISVDQAIQAIFDKMKRFTGIEAEVCGSWLWVGGKSWKYKKELKAMGMKWANNKGKWYWHEGGYKKKSKRVFSMDDIRNAWGSCNLETEPLSALG